jgi:Flp pilus assembly protein TadG
MEPAMLRSFVRSLIADRRGSLLPSFALALVPIFALLGAAVDYSRANAVKSAMQAALDATALAMAQNAASLNATDLQAQAQAYFNALFSKQPAGTVTLTVSYTTTNGPQISITGTTNVKTTFMAIPKFGISQIAVGGSSTAAWGNTRLRVALALDNTGSMDWSNKMTSLKTAAKNLIDQLKAAATNDGDVYVSIIPFAKDVNVGASNYTASWLDWTDWDNVNGSCSNWHYDTKTDCVAANKTWTTANHNTWTGCVTDRDQPYNTTNDAPSTTAKAFIPEQYSDCPAQLMPLSYNWTALKSKIDAMTPNGNTNTTIGLEWGWHSLTQNAPLNAPAEDSRYVYNKVIIFLTDGTNTQDRWDTSSYDGSLQQQNIDNRMKTACTNAKTAGFTIYTIQVIDGNDQLLKACASSADKYFKIATANQLVTVFSQIGTSLSKLRVAK